jgi:hypothetical protein
MSQCNKRCENPRCNKPMKVRAADIARGWGRFCSKSCKAQEQENRTGQYQQLLNQELQPSELDLDYDPSWDSHKRND